MIAVAGFWNFGYNTPLTEISMWRFPLRDFGVDKYIMSPITGIRGKVNEYEDLDAILNDHPDLTPVFVDEKGTVELQDFEHPENALYILGRPGYSPFMNYPEKLSVRLNTKMNKGLLWADQAICIVLYDRVIKDGNNNN